MNILVFSGQLRIPLMNSYVSMCLLAHIVGQLERWKRRELREKDFLEATADFH